MFPWIMQRIQYACYNADNNAIVYQNMKLLHDNMANVTNSKS